MLCSQQILAALKQRLVDAATAAGSRVYSDRLWPLDESKLPALRVYERDEQIEPQTIHWPRLQEHALGLAVEMCAQAVSGIDTVLAALRLEVEQALFDSIAHATLGLDGPQLALSGVGPLEPIEGKDRQLASRQIALQATYRTFENAPEAFA
jgi:hypothetical protein